MEKIKILLPAVICSLMGCAATYEDAQKSYQDGDYSEAREIWQELAREGDVKSMHQLFQTANRPKNSDIHWLKKAADLNYVQAEYDYGIWAINNGKYQEGYDYLLKAKAKNMNKAEQYLDENKKLIPLLLKAESGKNFYESMVAEYYWDKADYTNALAWLNKCDKYSYCQFYLGLANDQGHGIKENNKNAYKWYALSAAQGHKYSMRNLAWLYEDGSGVAMDKEKAFYWMKKASDNSALHANSSLGRYYLFGIGTNKNYSLAYKLLSSEASKSSSAAYRLGQIYYNGWGVKKNYKLSYKWFLNAAKKEHAASMWYLGQHHYLGYGQNKNYRDAFNWYLKSAEKGDRDAQFRLGWMYSNALGVKKDPTKAFYWYQKSAENGHSAAQNNLAVIYKRGNGTVKSNKKAFYWYEKAASQGDEVAQYNIASEYEYGGFYRKNYRLAAFWYAKSAQQNYKKSEAGLQRMLRKLNTRRVKASKTSIYTESNFSSDIVKNLNYNSPVYVLSEGSDWIEIYDPENKTLGFIKKSHLL